MQIYQGKQSNAINLSLGTRAIINMVSLISSNSNVLYRQLYFDNFLTSDHLITELAEKSVRATGTIRQNRIEWANKQLVQSKELRKKERSTYDYCSNGKVYIAKWHDNSVVNIANTGKIMNLCAKVRRRIKGGAIEVTQPHLINSYNKCMGGVNLMNRFLESYHPTICGKNGIGPWS